MTEIETFKPAVTVEGAKKIGTSNASLENLTSELIDNTITVKIPEIPYNIRVRLTYRDNKTSKISILDNSIGIPKEEFKQIFSYGGSGNIGLLLLSKMGMGMKMAIAGLGQLDKIITKTKGNPPYIITCNNEPDAELEYSYQPYVGDAFPNDHDSGTLIEIKNSDMVRKWTNVKDWDKYCSNIESTYPGLLNKHININITYIRGKHTFIKDLRGYHPLMSHPTQIITGTDTDDWYGLGSNMPILDKELLKIPGHPDIKAYLTAWHKPYPTQVQHYCNSLKGDDPNKEIYNLHNYENSPWYWGKSNGGISLMFNGKVLQHDIQTGWTERNERHGIILEIEEGIDFTALKSGVKQTKAWQETVEEIKRVLKVNNFEVRALVQFPAVSEDKYLNGFLERLKTDTIWRKYFNILDDKQILFQPNRSYGRPDAIIMTPDFKFAAYVIEAKKDRAGAPEARQLCGYLVSEYAASKYMAKGIFLSPKKLEPSFLQVREDFNEFSKERIEILEIEHIDSLSIMQQFVA